MRIGVRPIGSPGSEAGLYAAELARAMCFLECAGLEVALFGDTGAPTTNEVDLLHLVGTNVPTLNKAVEGFLGVTASTVVGGVLHVGRGQDEPTTDSERFHRYVCLSETASDLLRRRGFPSKRVGWAPCPVPAAFDSTGRSGTYPPTYLLILLPHDGDAGMVEQAIKCLPELSVDVHAVVAIDASALDSVEAVERARRTATETRVETRVHCVFVTTAAEIEDAIAQAELVIVTAETVAGPWHGLRPLRSGKPMLAPHLPLFEDVLFRGGGIRLVRHSIADHLAACVRAVLANPIGMAEMHERGIAYAEANTYEAHARRLMELFEETLAA